MRQVNTENDRETDGYTAFDYIQWGRFSQNDTIELMKIMQSHSQDVERQLLHGFVWTRTSEYHVSYLRIYHRSRLPKKQSDYCRWREAGGEYCDYFHADV